MFNDLTCDISAAEIESEYIDTYFPENNGDIYGIVYDAKFKNISYGNIVLNHGMNITMSGIGASKAYRVFSSIEIGEE